MLFFIFHDTPSRHALGMTPPEHWDALCVQDCWRPLLQRCGASGSWGPTQGRRMRLTWYTGVSMAGVSFAPCAAPRKCVMSVFPARAASKPPKCRHCPNAFASHVRAQCLSRGRGQSNKSSSRGRPPPHTHLRAFHSPVRDSVAPN